MSFVSFTNRESLCLPHAQYHAFDIVLTWMAIFTCFWVCLVVVLVLGWEDGSVYRKAVEERIRGGGWGFLGMEGVSDKLVRDLTRFEELERFS